MVESLTVTFPAPPVLKTIEADQFSFNTDGSDLGEFSNTHSGQTATGIGNGGEMLGYTLPLDRSLKRIKRYQDFIPQTLQAAILEFSFADKSVKLLAVANDTGGRHVDSDPLNRGWGELGINTWRALQARGCPVELGRNSLSVPDDLQLTYHFLSERISTVEDYRSMQLLLTEQDRL